ncbi:MAG: ABC transporter ATP-binding protein [Tannerella sp.]|jgi:iron complex transport system ATP-binding protein|nr:ABC transporter ATP-binding protein [Tannerella sp.]
MKPVIETTSLAIGYRSGSKKEVTVNDSLNLQLFAGELTALLGLNGAGKSTLLRTLCGFQPALNGSIRLMDNELSDYSQSRLGRTIGVVLTEKTNAGGISVYELVSLGRHPYTDFLGNLKQADHQIIEEAIAAVGIAHKARDYVSELSDGERQKAMIAKVLAQQCPVILLDEPTAFLDVTSRIETMALLRRLAVEQQKAILLSTHDLELAIQTCDCLWLQAKSSPMCCGAPEDLILNGDFERFFGKEGIVIDRSTGKLSAVATLNPIGVDGDATIVSLVGNALIRNGFRPSPISNDLTNIFCMDINRLKIVRKNDKEIIVNTVAALIACLRD